MFEPKVFDGADYESLLACSYELMTLVAAEFISEVTALFEQFQVNIDAKNWCLHLSRKS